MANERIEAYEKAEKEYLQAVDEFEEVENAYELEQAKQREIIRTKGGGKVTIGELEDKLLILQNTEGTELNRLYLELVSKRSTMKVCKLASNVANKKYWKEGM